MFLQKTGNKGKVEGGAVFSLNSFGIGPGGGWVTGGKGSQGRGDSGDRENEGDESGVG